MILSEKWVNAASTMDYTLSIVLVRTLYSSNIGATARAMSNMGAQRLILISPQCEIDLAAHQAAASGQKPLETQRTYKSWNDFLTHEKSGLRVALSARDGRGRDTRDLSLTLDFLKKETNKDWINDNINPLYMVLGPEDWGLSAEDLGFCHYCCCLPTYGDKTSLNLAQAALLSLFMVRSRWGGQRTKLNGQVIEKIEEKSEAQSISVFPEDLLKLWLETLGYDLSKKKINVFTLLRRVLMRAVLSFEEIRILEMILRQNIRKLNENGHHRRSQ